MSALQEALEQYLAVRRALGFDLRGTETALQQFVRFAAQEDVGFITTELALRWAQQPAHTLPSWWVARLSMVRGFARYCHAIDPRTEIPPQGLLPHRYRRRPPYLYSDQEVEQLLQAAQKLPSKMGLRSVTYTTLFGLLAATGMRMRETLHLDCEDVDLTGRLLTIRETKFRKSRYIPIHPTTQQALREYRTHCDRLYRKPSSPSFFLSDKGHRLSGCSVRRTFIKLSHQIGLRGPSDSHGPRLHDLRHRFAIQTLLKWYRSGVDVERQIPKLATYLGHTHFNDTYWYLTGVPELLQCAALRLEDSPQKGVRL